MAYIDLSQITNIIATLLPVMLTLMVMMMMMRMLTSVFEKFGEAAV